MSSEGEESGQGTDAKQTFSQGGFLFDLALPTGTEAPQCVGPPGPVERCRQVFAPEQRGFAGQKCQMSGSS